MALALCLVAALSAFTASPPATPPPRVLLYVDPKEPSEGAEAQTIFAAAEVRKGCHEKPHLCEMSPTDALALSL